MAISGSLTKGIQLRPWLVLVAGTCGSAALVTHCKIYCTVHHAASCRTETTCAAELDKNCMTQMRKGQRCSATTPCALRICRSLGKDNIKERSEAYLGHPRHGALPVVSGARQAASRNGVADGQVAGAAVLVILAAGGRLRINPYSSGAMVEGLPWEGTLWSNTMPYSRISCTRWLRFMVSEALVAPLLQENPT